MLNDHLTMVKVNCPRPGYFPVFGMEVDNELFYYMFDGDPDAPDGYMQLGDEPPRRGIRNTDNHMRYFGIVE